MKTVLTIAGSDCSGGAGIQADLKTITAYGMYGMSVITALTVQNTLGVSAVQEAENSILAGQLEAVFSDLYPDAVKTGMLPSGRAVSLTAEALKRYRPPFVVLDPVMVSTSGRKLMDDGTVEIMMAELIPQVTVITPNIPEACVLLDKLWVSHGPGVSSELWVSPGGEEPDRKHGAGKHRAEAEIRTCEDMERAAITIGTLLGISVLIKGGHRTERADDCLFCDGTVSWFRGDRLDVKNTHGTGCTLSSAIACGLADGLTLAQSVETAKRYLTNALKAEPGLGHGNGPLNHCFAIEGFQNT